mmetsp:Transcript_65286/g.156028  ORF Transcript_65286/g.156028 Transcript_65286/m.156028 type:complete len:593 (-) Transcript_65286:152-1930(-)
MQHDVDIPRERQRRPASAGSAPSLPAGSASQAALASRDSISGPSAHSVPIVADLSQWRTAVNTYAKPSYSPGAPYYTAARAAGARHHGSTSSSKDDRGLQDSEKLRKDLAGTMSKLLRTELQAVYVAVCQHVDFSVGKGLDLMRTEFHSEVSQLIERIDTQHSQLSLDVRENKVNSSSLVRVEDSKVETELSKAMYDMNTTQYAEGTRTPIRRNLMREAAAESEIMSVAGDVRRLSSGIDLSEVVGEIRKAKLDLTTEIYKMKAASMETEVRDLRACAEVLPQMRELQASIRELQTRGLEPAARAALPVPAASPQEGTDLAPILRELQQTQSKVLSLSPALAEMKENLDTHRTDLLAKLTAALQDAKSEQGAQTSRCFTELTVEVQQRSAKLEASTAVVQSSLLGLEAAVKEMLRSHSAAGNSSTSPSQNNAASEDSAGAVLEAVQRGINDLRSDLHRVVQSLDEERAAADHALEAPSQQQLAVGGASSRLTASFATSLANGEGSVAFAEVLELVRDWKEAHMNEQLTLLRQDVKGIINALGFSEASDASTTTAVAAAPGHNALSLRQFLDAALLSLKTEMEGLRATKSLYF